MKANTETSALHELVARVRERRKSQGAVLPKSGWRQVAGSVKDDELFREAARLGEEWRKKANLHP